MEWCAKLPAPVLGLGGSCSVVPVPGTLVSDLGRAWERDLYDGLQSFQLQSRDADLGGSAGLCELRVRVSITPSAGWLLFSGKAGKHLERPVRLPRCLGMLGAQRLSVGCAKPQVSHLGSYSAALPARRTCWGHTCAFISDIQGGTKQEPRIRHQFFTPNPPKRQKWL